jgi:hypothetical protein
MTGARPGSGALANRRLRAPSASTGGSVLAADTRRWPYVLAAGGVCALATVGAALSAYAAGGAHGRADTESGAVVAAVFFLLAFAGWWPAPTLGAVGLAGFYTAGLLRGASGGSAPVVALCIWLAAETAVWGVELRTRHGWAQAAGRRLSDLAGIAAGTLLLGAAWIYLGEHPLPGGTATEVAGLAAGLALVGLFRWGASPPRRKPRG